MTSTMTSKGQVTLPKKFRDYLGVEPGAKVSFVLGPNGEVLVRAATDEKPARRVKSRLARLRGTLKTGKSTDDLMRHLRGYDADGADPGFK